MKSYATIDRKTPFEHRLSLAVASLHGANPLSANEASETYGVSVIAIEDALIDTAGGPTPAEEQARATDRDEREYLAWRAKQPRDLWA